MPKRDNEQLAERLSEVERRLDSLGNAAAPPKEVLTLEEASEFLGLSKSQIYKLTGSASIPHYKPNGKYIYFDRAELIEWVKHNPVRTKKEHELDAIRYVASKPLKRN